MSDHLTIPVALTIAGSDSGGGAGIQADLKTFAALEVHGTSVVTCVTAQDSGGVIGIEACSSRIVRQQIEAVWRGFKPMAIKTGMLYSAPIIRAVVDGVKSMRGAQLIVDPVMVATSGRTLLEPAAIKFLSEKLLPLATLVTPNLDEAAKLSGRTLRSVEDMREAAREIQSRYGCSVLVKGGHLKGMREAADIFFDGKEEWLFTHPFIKGVRTHGTGCTYSAAIAAHLAHGLNLMPAIMAAKAHITRTIENFQVANKHAVLNNFWWKRLK